MIFNVEKFAMQQTSFFIRISIKVRNGYTRGRNETGSGARAAVVVPGNCQSFNINWI